jgi:hypothetical protein
LQTRNHALLKTRNFSFFFITKLEILKAGWRKSGHSKENQGPGTFSGGMVRSFSQRKPHGFPTPLLAFKDSLFSFNPILCIFFASPSLFYFTIDITSDSPFMH